MNLFLVMAGGAGARHLASRAALAIAGPGLPVGTLAINVAGGLLMGVLAGLLARTTAGEPWRLFLGVGVLGGFTTFSAFSLDAVLLAERGQWVAAVGYVLASVVGSIAALVAGLTLARTLTGAAA